MTYLRKTPTQGLLDCGRTLSSFSVLISPTVPSIVSRVNELTLVACVERHHLGPEPREPGARPQCDGVADPISTAFPRPQFRGSQESRHPQLVQT